MFPGRRWATPLSCAIGLLYDVPSALLGCTVGLLCHAPRSRQLPLGEELLIWPGVPFQISRFLNVYDLWVIICFGVLCVHLRIKCVWGEVCDTRN